MKRRSTFLQALRAEARATLHVLLLLLLIPVLHPVAEARALENGMGSVICFTFGDADADPLALADDLPDCVTCAMTAAALPPPVPVAGAIQGLVDDVIRPARPVPGDAQPVVHLPPSHGPPSLA